MVASRFADALGQSKIPALDLAGNYDQLGQFITSRLATDFQPYGLTLVNLFVENISLPPEVEAAMDKRTSMGVIGNLQAYTQYQTAESIPDAAKNPGGLAGSAAGMVMGMNMANNVAAGMNANQQIPASGPPPLPKAVSFFVAINGQQAGPFEVSALEGKVGGGQMTRDTLVWRQGMPTWTAASGVPELKSLFDNMPPPVPQG
jgi:hypothetical protein